MYGRYSGAILSNLPGLVHLCQWGVCCILWWRYFFLLKFFPHCSWFICASPPSLIPLLVSSDQQFCNPLLTFRWCLSLPAGQHLILGEILQSCKVLMHGRVWLDIFCLLMLNWNLPGMGQTWNSMKWSEQNQQILVWWGQVQELPFPTKSIFLQVAWRVHLFRVVLSPVYKRISLLIFSQHGMLVFINHLVHVTKMLQSPSLDLSKQHYL